MGKDTFFRVAAILFVLSCNARAQTQDAAPAGIKTPTIKVTGSGSVQVEPDAATITIGVTNEDPNSASAVARNTADTAKVVAALEEAGIERKDLKTSNFSVYTQYRGEGANKQQVLTFRVTNTVTVTIRDISKAGDLLTKAAAAGSNQINGPSFTVSNPEKYIGDARKKAVEDALAKARDYAAAAGLKLGAILEMSEPSPVAIPAARAGGYVRSAAAVFIESGEETLQASVVLVIELKP
jgi:uncharacterized protein